MRKTVFGRNHRHSTRIYKLSSLRRLFNYLLTVETRYPLIGVFVLSAGWLLVGMLVFSNYEVQADTAPSYRATGKAILAYNESTAVVKNRTWTRGSASFSSATNGPTLPGGTSGLETVIKASPTRDNERVMAVRDANNLHVYRSTDNGTNWTLGFSVATTASAGRPFDVAFEQNSGEAVVVYSKNATTNEIGFRRWTGSSWATETTIDPARTAAIVTWIELAEKKNSDDLAMGYLIASATNNINALIWSGSGNTFGNEPGANFGSCDQGATAGVDKCFDVNYETASGLPVVSWGISSTGNAASTIRASRWDGTSWTTNTLTLGSTGDDTTTMDCEADPTPGSNEILCGSVGASTTDAQGWTVVSGTLGVAGADRDTGAHAAASGQQMIAATYIVSNGIRRGVIAYADAVSASSDNQIDYFTFDGATFSTVTTFAKTFGDDKNIIAVTNPYNMSEAVFLIADENSALYAERVTLSGTTVTWSDLGSSSLGTVSALDGVVFDIDFDPLGQKPIITQDSTIIENDDEDLESRATRESNDNNTQQAAANTAITGVKKGERLTVRTHIKNTGGRNRSDLAMFYDRNDNIFTKVQEDKPPVTAAGNCTDNNWDCGFVDDATNGAGEDSSIAVDPHGNPWISYKGNDGGGVDVLMVARYVGTGGTGCGGSVTSWTCMVVDDPTNEVSWYSGIAFDATGNPWVAYRDASANAVKVAHYVGTGGTGCTGNSVWTCVTVEDTANSTAWYMSMTTDYLGNPWIAYYDFTLFALRVARYVGAGGTGCTTTTTWTCMTVDDPTNDVGFYTSIATDANGTAWVSYYDNSAGALKVAKYVGAGGTGCGGNTTWTCTTIEDVTNNVGVQTSIAIDSSGNPWISYRDSSAAILKVARYVGGSGNCATSSAWTCYSVDDPAVNNMEHSAIAFDAAGKAWVSYKTTDGTNNILKVARFVGTGGNCTNGDAGWTCATVDDPTNSAGSHNSITFDHSGNAWVSYYDASTQALKYATTKRGGELVISSSSSGTLTDTLIESHGDMTSTTDTTNRDDADCVSATTWNNGQFFESENGVIGLPSGAGTSQCTEVAFTIDTSQAVAGRTYRLVIATEDNIRYDRGGWRGTTVSSGAYATITIEADTTMRAAKTGEQKYTNCTNTDWGCFTVDDPSDSVGDWMSLAFDADGDPWMAYRNDGFQALRVAEYNASTLGCASDWVCTHVEAFPNIGNYTSMAFDNEGNPWIAYNNETNKSLRYARYVGSGGSGCDTGSTAWSCAAIDLPTGTSGTNFLGFISLVFDKNGIPWISYFDETKDLKLARYVGSGGSGCTETSDWTCEVVHTTANVIGERSSLAFDNDNNPWIAYHDRTARDVYIARFKPNNAAASGCALHWECTNVDSSNEYGQQGISLAFDQSNVAHIAYTYNNAGAGAIRYATYVGSSGSGCASGAWTCSTLLDTTNDVGYYPSLAFDATGQAWISHYDFTAGDLRLIKEKTGNGASGGCLANWECIVVDANANDVGNYSSLAFDPSGTPWIAHADNTAQSAKITKLHLSATKPTRDATQNLKARNAVSSDAMYRLADGRSPRTESGTCSGITDRKGYCGIATNDSNFDGVLMDSDQRPVYTFATKSATNTAAPTATWVGRTPNAPSSSGTTNDIVLQVYRFGSTNAWENVAINSTSTGCSLADCTVTGTAGGTAGEYYETDGANYWAYFRVWQYETSSDAEFRTDYFNATFGSSNTNPNVPASLAQKRTSDAGIPATMLYDFDTSITGFTDANGGTLSRDTTTKRTGASSLRSVSTNTFWINDGQSSPRNLSANGPTFSAWVYVPASNDGGTWQAYLSIFDSTGTVNNDGPITNIPRDTWTLIKYSPSTSLLANMTYIAIGITGGAGASNSIYIDDIQQGYATWTNQNSVKFTASLSDPDASDTLQLCVEYQPLGTSFFSDTAHENCGTGVAYSGSAVSASVTVNSITDATEYHWQARTKDVAGAYSSWVSYGGNSESTVDFGIDTTAPTGGTVYDGTSAGVDAAFNDGSLSAASGNWSGINSNVSGLLRYEYSIGTTVGGTDIKDWTDNQSSTSVTASSLNLQTSKTYYFNVRALDQAGNTQSAITSDGQLVAPSLSFSVSPTSLTFANLNASNSYTDTQTTTVTTSTNAYNGYVVRLAANDSLRSTDSSTVNDFSGGTYALPDSWQTGDTGFGYTSNDALVQGVNKFQASTCPGGSALVSPGCYAPYSQTKPGDIVADHTANVTGTPIANQAFTITHRITTSAVQAARDYTTILLYTITAIY